MKSVDEYVDLMSKLNLPNPKMMDVAVPANMRVGLAQDEIARKGWAVTPAQAMALVGQPAVALVDLRERSERDKHGSNSRLCAHALRQPARKHPQGRHAAGAGQFNQQTHPVLLRIR